MDVLSFNVTTHSYYTARMVDMGILEQNEKKYTARGQRSDGVVEFWRLLFGNRLSC